MGLIRESVLNNQRPDLNQLPLNTIQIQQIMTRCWQQEQHARPSFAEIENEIEVLFKLYEKQVVSAMKSIRRQIIEQHAVNDEEYIHTAYIDEMEVDMIEDVTSHDLPAFPVSPMATDQPIRTHADTTAAPAAPTVTISIPTDGHKSSEPFVMKIRKDDLNYEERELKNILPDALFMDMHKENESNLSHFDKRLTNYFNDPNMFQDLVNNNTVWRSELMRSNSPFFSALSLQRLRHAELQSHLQQQKYRQEDAQKFYSYMKHQSPEDMNESEKRRYEKMMDLRVCSYGRKLETGGMADKVINALKEPGYLKAALDEKETKPGEPQRFKVIDPKVKELLKDPMILQIVLSQEPELLDNLMRQHPELIMRLLAEGKTEYRPPDLRRNFRRSPRDMAFMYRMIRGPMGGGPRRRMDDSDSDDDDFFFHGREPRRRPGLMNMGPGSREQRRQDEMMNQIIADRKKKENEEREKRKKEEQNRRDSEKQRREADKKDKGQRQKELDKKMIEMLTQQSMRAAKQREMDRLLRETQKQINSKDNKDKDESVKSLKEQKIQTMPDMLKRPHSELGRDVSSSGQSMPSIDQLSMEEESNTSPQPSPPKQTKDTPHKPTAVVQAETQRASVEPGTSSSKSPTGMKQEPIPSTAGEVGGNTPGKQEKGEKMEVDASTFRPGPEPANDDKDKVKGEQMKVEPGTPMTISHVHGSGTVTHITMPGNLDNVPNLQIGNKNKMIVFQGGASGSSKIDEPPKRKKSDKSKKIDVDKFPEDVLNMDQIDKIAMDIGKDWKKLCRAMDLSDAEIEQLEYDYQINGLYEMMYQGIQRWMQKKARRATVREMVKKLLSIDRDDLILDLKK